MAMQPAPPIERAFDVIEGGRDWRDDEHEMELQARRTEARNICDALLPDLNRIHLVAVFHGDAVSEQMAARSIRRVTRYRARNAEPQPLRTA